jgi:phage terminase small subunit
VTPKQCAFVKEYLLDLNAAEAARRAGYKAKSQSGLKIQGARLLRHPVIRDEIAKAMQDHPERLRITADMVLNEYAKLAFADPRRLINWGPDGVTLSLSSDLTEAEVAQIAEVVQTRSSRGDSLRVKLRDRKAALDALARYLGLFDKSGPGEGKEMDDDLTGKAETALEELIGRIDRMSTRKGKERATRQPE